MHVVGGRRRTPFLALGIAAVCAAAAIVAFAPPSRLARHDPGRAHAAPRGVDDDETPAPPPAPTTTPDADGWIRLATGAADYAPAGLPDFDQHVPLWQSRDPIRKVWTHDGPLAVADALWWLDARREAGPPPPAIVDQFGLVRALGDWDDHAAQNVRPLGQALAAAFRTNGVLGNYYGTCLDELDGGLRAYLHEVGTDPVYGTRIVEKPTLGQLAEAIGRGEPPVALIGLWQNTRVTGWSRIGGHYAAIEAVDPVTGKLRLSDPYLDVAAPAGGPDAHTDAAVVSHDAWTLSPSLRPGPVLRLDGYLESTGDVAGFLANFYGQNRRTCADSDVGWSDGDPVEAHLDTLLVIQVAPPPTATPTPTSTPSATPTDTATATPSATATATRDLTPRTLEPTATDASTRTPGTPEPTSTEGTATEPSPTARSTTAPRPSRTPTAVPPPTETPPSEPPATATADPAAPTGAPVPTQPPGGIGTATPTPSHAATATSAAPAESATPTRTPTQRPTAIIPTLMRPTRTPTPTETIPPLPTDPPTATPAPTRTPGPGDVCGAVHDQRTRKPLAQVKVWLYRSEEPLGVTRTVGNGTFCFLALPHGRYDVRAERSGCTTTQQSVDIVGGMKFVEITLPCRRYQAHLPLVVKRKRVR